MIYQINEQYINLLNPSLIFNDNNNLSCLNYNWICYLPLKYRIEILNKIVNQGKFLWTLNHQGLKQLIYIFQLNNMIYIENYDLMNEFELRQYICLYYDTFYIDPYDEPTIRIYDIEIELYKSKIIEY